MFADPDRLLDLLDAGAVRAAVALAQEQPELGPLGSRAIVAAWGRMGGGDPPGAAAELRPLIPALESPGERRVLGHGLLALGVASVLSGAPDPGTGLLERAFSLLAAPWAKAQCLRFLGLALEQRGAWEGAAARYGAAAEIYAQIQHDYGLGSALYGAATAHSERADDREALRLMNEAVPALRRSGGGPALGAALALLAVLAAEQQDPQAISLIDEAESLASDASMFRSDIKLRRAEVSLRMGRPEESLTAVTEALALSPADGPDRSSIEQLRAQALFRLGHREAAAALLEGPAPMAGPGRLERLALQIRIASEGELSTVDRLLPDLERLIRAGLRRRGVAGLLREGGEALAATVVRPPDADRAVWLLQLSMLLGAPLHAPLLHRLRAQGARVPLGPLWLEAPLGQGGMGEVWSARHRDGGRVAVKLLREGGTGEQAAFLEAELQALTRLDHPGVVRLLAALRLEEAASSMLDRPVGSMALVMELVPGGSLESRLSGWRWPALRALFGALLAGLAHAHAREVLHLDIKPGNILIDEVDGTLVPRLADFGLTNPARRAGRSRVLGTPAYMAPEQAWVDGPLGPATDLYAVGCLAWQLITGKVPYFAEEPTEILALHRAGQLPEFRPLTPVPEGLEDWLRTLLARRPEQRYPCAADAAWALMQLGDVQGPATFVSGSGGVVRTFDLADLSTPWPGLANSSGAMRALPPLDRAATPASLPRAPFPSDWRALERRRSLPFLPGAGEGLFAWRRGRLVGREGERDRLWAALAALREGGPGRLIWVIGADGLGRSALLRWLGETALATGATVPGHKSAARPSLFLVDDADGADAAVELTARVEAGGLVVAAARAVPEDSPDGERIELGPLSEGELTLLLDDLLPLDPALAGRLATRAAGSPAFAVGLLTELVRRDALESGPDGFCARLAEDLPLPQDLGGLWAERLETLAPTGSPRRSAWEIAAVLGENPSRELWKGICDRVGLSAEDGVFTPLEAAGWLGQEEERLCFRVPALREALRVGAEAAGRAAVWHGVAAELLSDRGDVAAGRHFALAGRHVEALTPLRRAAADAVNRMQLESCRSLVALWERSADAIGLALDDPRRASVVVVRAHLALHSREDAEGLLRQGLALVAGRDAVIEAQLHYTRGWILARAGRHEEADPCFAEAIRLAEGQGELVAVAQLGRAASLFARGEDARALVEEARGRLGTGQEALGLRADACLGKGLYRLGFPAEARRWLLRAAARAERAGAREVEAEALTELAELSWEDGSFSDSVRWMERAVGVLSGTGSDLAWGAAVRLGGFLWGVGREEEARTVLAPIRQRFVGRLRGPMRAEWALLHGLLNGEDVQALLEPGGGVEEVVRRRLGRHLAGH